MRLPRGTGLSNRALALAAAGALAASIAPASETAAASPAPAAPADRDSLSVVVPANAQASVRQHRPFSITVRGVAAGKARVFAFVDFDPCLSTPALEKQRDARFVSYSVKSTFSRRSRWESSLRRTDHACAYMVDVATGTVVRHAFATFLVH